MGIGLKLRIVTRLLLMLAGGFVLAHVVLQFMAIYMGHALGSSFLDLELEEIILRFLSALLLLLCSSLFLIIAISRKRNRIDYTLHWLGLALIFFFLAVTKETAVHEYLAAQFRSALHLSKIRFYTWTYGIVMIIFPVLFLRFLLSLPRRTLFLLVMGGFTFIAGAFGLDLIVAYLGTSIDHESVVYIGLASLEDVLEMSGTIVIVYGLLSFMSSELKWMGAKAAG